MRTPLGTSTHSTGPPGHLGVSLPHDVSMGGRDTLRGSGVGIWPLRTPLTVEPEGPGVHRRASIHTAKQDPELCPPGSSGARDTRQPSIRAQFWGTIPGVPTPLS